MVAAQQQVVAVIDTAAKLPVEIAPASAARGRARFVERYGLPGIGQMKGGG